MSLSSKRLAITLNLLRGVLLFLAGVLAMVLPETALRVVVIVAGAFLVVDGVLGALASQNYGIEASWPFWLSVTRGVLAIVAGLALMFSPLLVSVLTTTFLAVAIAIGAIAVGLTELFILMRYREQFPPVWSTVAGALIYIAIGAVLLALPFTGAIVLMQVGGALLALFGLVQIVRAWMSSSTSLGARQTH